VNASWGRWREGRVGFNLNAGINAKWTGLALHSGYTITNLVEELVERAERRVTARLPSRPLKPYYDAEGLGYGIALSTPPKSGP
jgi:hypothetical protein